MVPGLVRAFFLPAWHLTLLRQSGSPAVAFFPLQQVVLPPVPGALLGARHRPFSPTTLWNRYPIPYAELLNTAILSNHSPVPIPRLDRSRSRAATPRPARPPQAPRRTHPPAKNAGRVGQPASMLPACSFRILGKGFSSQPASAGLWKSDGWAASFSAIPKMRLEGGPCLRVGKSNLGCPTSRRCCEMWEGEKFRFDLRSRKCGETWGTLSLSFQSNLFSYEEKAAAIEGTVLQCVCV